MSNPASGRNGASDQLLANAIRALAMDAVEKAKSGHPGMPMGMADIAVALWNRHLRHNPANPHWSNRDRFVLSNGHGSMLQYALLHLTGYDLPMSELENFRQLNSKTPGHPEVGVTPGIETTTGPLGQGLANAVGMALAERLLAAEFNRPGLDIIDHHTYVFCGDGCLMEGISHEACALAGTWGLSKLVAFYDDNGISIDGEVKHWFTDDTPERFEAYRWNVVRNVDGHDVEAVDAAIKSALGQPAGPAARPTLICCKTIIGKGAPTKQGTESAHGAPLGEKEIAATRAALHWDYPPFVIPQAIYDGWNARECGAILERDWNALFARYRSEFAELAAEFERRTRADLPAQFETQARALVVGVNAKAETIATRKASQNALDGLSGLLPELLGGSADLTGSNLTNFKTSTPMRNDDGHFVPGNYLNYGVREFGMAGIMNGIALHRGHLPFGGTFLTFSDYNRNAIRMAALMKLRVIHVFTHDSIGLGEDGPTHQSVEHASALRLIPNLTVWRPCDTVETMVAWNQALLHRDGPSALLLTRQNVPFQPRDPAQIDTIARGGYVLSDAAAPQAILLATGSEVGLAMDARAKLAEAGIAVRVVSMPCTEFYDRQDAAYKASVLPDSIPKVAIEAGVTGLWWKYIGLHGGTVGIDTFGESAPAPALFKHFGFTVDHVVETVHKVLA
ncbi:MAG: transketolase [Betaproteobacteria bacterium]